MRDLFTKIQMIKDALQNEECDTKILNWRALNNSELLLAISIKLDKPLTGSHLENMSDTELFFVLKALFMGKKVSDFNPVTGYLKNEK